MLGVSSPFAYGYRLRAYNRAGRKLVHPALAWTTAEVGAALIVLP
jgi:hypothetical protein